MKTLLFVDHAFHTSTASSQFFIDLLKRRYDVKIVHIAPPSNMPAETLELAAAVDVVVVWQMDYIAPVFLALGVPTVVVPMYDGSGSMPDLHWLWSSRAQFVNFSFTLHHRIAGLGNRSVLARYFTEPVPEAERASFDDGLKAFLWQRRPEHGINAPALMRLLDGQIDSMHVHNAPDDADVDMRPYKVASSANCKITQSNWFPTAAGYHDALSRANVFIAPRRAEGIGMALLEAMGRGMLVVASDEPTHNEYIANWLNGVLYDPDATPSITIHGAEAMGAMAYETARLGRQRWNEQAPAILALIDACVAPPKVDIDVMAFADALSAAYYSGLSTYVTFMLSNSKLFGEMSDVSVTGRLDKQGNLLPKVTEEALPSSIPWLAVGRIPLDAFQGATFVASGQVEHHGGTAWLAGHCVEFDFRADPIAESFSRLAMHVSKPTEIDRQSLVVTLNGYTLGIRDVSDGGGKLEFDVPLHVVHGQNRLRLQATDLGGGGSGYRFVALALHEIVFS